MISDKKLIMIVDDNKDMRTILGALFADQGFSTIGAASGAAALRIFQNRKIDVVLLDKRLPDTDGFEIISRLKDRRTSSKLIIITAYSDHALTKEALKLGADACLSKPFNNAELIELVKNST